MIGRLLRTSLSLFFAALLLPATTIAAPVVNGDFETGNFAGWKLFYDGAALASSAAYPPIQGNYSALIVALSGQDLDNNAPCAEDPWSIYCPNPLPRYTGDGTTLTYPVYFLNYGGGAIGQDIQVRQGDVLTWDWKCISPYDDCIDGSSSGGNLFDVGYFMATNTNSFPVAYMATTDQQDGLNSESFVFPTGGLWTIYFGVDQSPDPYYSSLLFLDNVVLLAVPEPTTLALLGLGIAGLAFARRRKQ